MSNEAHEKGIEAAHQELRFQLHEDWISKENLEDAIKAYLEASGLVLVPRDMYDAVQDVLHTVSGTDDRHNAMDRLISGFSSLPTQHRR